MKTVLLSLGGSIIVPDKPDYFFLREFKNFILRYIDDYRFVIVCGGGKTNNYYNHAAKRVSQVRDEDLDWIGIMATRLNAEMVRSIFGEIAYKKVIYNPHRKIRTKKKIIVAAGWKPGCSTDTDAVILAEENGIEVIINMTNISHVYDKDPKEPGARKIDEISWKDYRKIVGDEWSPRLNSPFDPVASKRAQKNGMKVIVLDGTDLKNIEKYLLGRTFHGTVIS